MYIPLVILTALFTAGLTLAQVLASKLIEVNVLGLYIAFPAGTIAYAITFLATDIAGEVYGRRVANTIVLTGLIVNVLIIAMTQIAIHAPIASFQPPEFQEWYARIFGPSLNIVIASIIAYLVSQTHDVWHFHKLRELTHGRHLWLRNNSSTIISQAIDTILFTTLAFYILPQVLPASLTGGAKPISLAELVHIVVGQWIVKVIVALCDTPFCYLGVKLIRKFYEFQTPWPVIISQK